MTPVIAFKPDTEGVFYDLDAKTYRSAPGINHSALKHIDPTPAHFQAYLAEPDEPSTAMILGSLVHARILEPAKALPAVIVPPETYPAPADCSAVKQKKAQPGDPLNWSWSANYCKAWKRNYEGAGMIILSQTEYDALEGCVNSVAKDPICRELFEKGRAEVSLFKTFTLGGSCLRKGRIDFAPVGNCLADVKTCQSAHDPDFSATILDCDYHTQAAYYLDLWNHLHEEKKEHFIIVAVEKRPPYLVAVYRVKQAAIGEGRKNYVNRLTRYIECSAANNWPGYPQEVRAIDLPAWFYKRNQGLARLGDFIA